MVNLEFFRLNKNEQQIYAKFVAGLKDFQESFTFFDTDTDTVINAYMTVYHENPQFFWLTNGYSLKSYKGASTKIVFTPTLNQKISPTVKQMYQKLQNTATDIAMRTMLKAGVYNRVLYVHDYLIDICDYSLGATHCYDAYGCLIEHKAACSGYSAAFKLILNLVGIPCGYVLGWDNNNQTKSTPSHQWNYVEMGGDFYHFDVTWDDPIVKNMPRNADNKSYAYFGLTSREIELTHKISNTKYVPICNGTRFNYYNYNNLLINFYSFEILKSIAVPILRANDHMCVKFTSLAQLKKAQHELIDESKIFDLYNFSGSVSYNINEKLLLLEIHKKIKC